MAGVQATAELPKSSTGGKVPQGMAAQQQQHPKRSPPRLKQLLPGHKRQKLSHSPEREGNKLDAAAFHNALLQQNKSQESGSDESATRWFDTVNKHVTQSAHDGTNYDDEPPFFMSHQKSYLPPATLPSEGSRAFGQSRIDSENEELRGVIDDLTIENRRLKHILRSNTRSQRGTPSNDGQDKLFEVRMHGLKSEKRRELEFLLKNFATSVHTTAPSMSNSVSGSGASSNSLTASKTRAANTDSGYASNSNSGQVSLNVQGLRGPPFISQSTRNNNIKNYLHDIPDTLMPRQQPIVLSERAKMALVVRRMEQLFTGRNAAPGEHSQPLQQQEVSNLAARADAKINRKRKAEGTREAHMLPPDSKVTFDVIDAGPERRQQRPGLKASDSDMSEVNSQSVSRPESPDQRPTRPLDLDIHRALVAAENIQYIRHLGLSSPHLETDSQDESWMYLNLLVNMAQLHTVNVTPEFIRKSIKKLSTKFQLSKDGNKVRWIGGPEGTVFSKEEEKALEVADHNKDNNSPDESTEDVSGTGGSSKRSKTDTNSNAVVSNTATSEDKTSGLQTSSASKQQISTSATSNQQSSLQTKPTQTSSAFDYRPIVYRERSHLPEESYLQDSDSSLGGTSRDSSGPAHALSQSNLNQQRRSDEGVITFYNNPFFCSDYSGDKMPSNLLRDRAAEAGVTLGVPSENEWEEKVSRLAEACYFTPQFGPTPIRKSDDEKLPTFKLAPITAAGEDETQPLEFICSGLGGITPDDNFALDVDVHMIKTSARNEAERDRRIPYTGTKLRPRFLYGQGSCNKIDLLPSRLPPPSYVFFTSSSSSDNRVTEDSDDGSDESSSSDHEDDPVPPVFLQHWSHNDSNEVDASDNELQDDSSVDMLAVARAVDPVRIAEQERQYVINQPGGRAVAGSLAATVGASQSSSSAGTPGDADDIDSDMPEANSQGDSDSDSEMDVDDE